MDIVLLFKEKSPSFKYIYGDIYEWNYVMTVAEFNLIC